MSEESTLDRVLFGSGNSWVTANRRPQGGSPPVNRHRRGPTADATTLQSWAGRYRCSELGQDWDPTFADGGLWIVPPGEAAQLLSPNGPGAMRMRAVNLWFAQDAFLLGAVDEITADEIDGLWFECVA